MVINLKKIIKEKKNVEKAIQAMATVNSNQKESYDTLITIKNSSNTNMVIDEISYDNFDKNKQSIRIAGRAKTDNAIVLFMDALRSDEKITQVTIDNMSSNNQSKIKNFTIRCLTETKQE